MNIRMAECKALLEVARFWLDLAEALNVGPLRLLSNWIIRHKIEPLCKAMQSLIDAELIEANFFNLGRDIDLMTIGGASSRT